MPKVPLLCFPGFMGRAQDFSSLVNHIGDDWPVQALNWPEPQGQLQVADYAQHCWQQLQDQLPPTFFVYGYSMGGRLLLHWWQNESFRQRCRGLIVSGAHFGLSNQSARQARAKSDAVWVKRFQRQPLCDSLNFWYEQEVFAHYSQQVRQQQIESKLDLDRLFIAAQLQAASLATQQDLSSSCRTLLKIFPAFAYVLGGDDMKFSRHVAGIGMEENLHFINQAGHNLHIEQPQRLAALLLNLLRKWSQS